MMPRKPKQPNLELVVDNTPPASTNDSVTVIAIQPLEQGVFAWVVESPPSPPRRPFHF